VSSKVWEVQLACFVGLLLAVLLLKQNNLTQLVLGFTGAAMTESKYRRFHRFFKEVYFYYDAIVRLIMEMFDFYQL